MVAVEPGVGNTADQSEPLRTAPVGRVPLDSCESSEESALVNLLTVVNKISDRSN